MVTMPLLPPPPPAKHVQTQPTNLITSATRQGSVVHQVTRPPERVGKHLSLTADAGLTIASHNTGGHNFQHMQLGQNSEQDLSQTLPRSNSMLFIYYWHELIWE